MIAAVLAKKPELILADEPTNDLDERWSDRIMELLMDETKNGGAVVLVTHDEKSASYAEKIYCLEDGKLNLQQ